MVHDKASELRRDDSPFPAEVDIRHIDAARALVLIDRERPFEKKAVYALELRIKGPQLRGHRLDQTECAGAADGEENDAAYAAAMLPELLHKMVEAVSEGVAGRENVADGEGAALRRAYLVVLDFQALDFVVLDHALARHEIDFANAYNRKDIGARALAGEEL